MPDINSESPKNQSQPLWTKNFILICLANLAVCISFHSLLPTLPVYIQAQGGTKETVGLALAALTIAAVMIRPIAGWAIDTYGRRLILLTGLVTFLLPSAFYLLMVPIVPLLFLRMFHGIGWGICNTAIGTVASDIVPKSRLGEGLGYFGSTGSLSLAIAPALSLWLIDAVSFEALFWFCSLSAVAAVLIAVPIKCPDQDLALNASKPTLVERSALKPSLVILLVALTYSSLLSFLALFLRQQGLSSSGLFFTAMALTTLGVRPLSGLLIDRYGLRGYNIVVFSGLVCLTAAMVVIAGISSMSGLIVSGLLYGIGFGFLQPSMLTLCISSAPSRRGAANATFWTAFDIGVAAGSILWGFIAEHWSYTLMFQLNTLSLVLAAAVYISIVKDRVKVLRPLPE